MGSSLLVICQSRPRSCSPLLNSGAFTGQPTTLSRKSKLQKDLTPLAEGLEQSRSGSGFGPVCYGEIISVLLTIFPFNPGIVEAEKRPVVGKGIGRAVTQGPITRNTLEASIRQEEQVALAVPPKSFVLASNLSLAFQPGRKPTRFAGKISLGPHLPQAFLDARSQLAAKIPEEDRFVRGYAGVLTRIRARSVGHAFEAAQEKQDLLRAMWNYALLRRTVWQSTTDPTAPLARLRFSRVHTLHEPTGALAIQNYWFNPEFRKQTFVNLSSTDWAEMQRLVRSLRQRLPRIAYRAELERAFIHYGRALDATDMESAFLKLWSVLEQISGVGGERYDTLVARTAFLFKPDKMVRYVLEHLRYQRNEIVHLGTPQSEMRPLVFQLKLYVERMMGMHLALGRHFESLEEAGQFMDLSHTAPTLRRKAKLIERALAFRGE